MMAEYFDTKAAINALVRLNNDSDMPTDWHKGVSSALSCLYRVPTVQPERKKGKWEWSEFISFNEQLKLPSCSLCRFVFTSRYNYCPNCGAEMEAEG